MITLGTAGGFLLVLGSYLVYKGNIYHSTIVFGLANFMFGLLAYSAGDVFGFITILIGMLLGLGTFIKIKAGVFKGKLYE
jgi:hypothetical protein